MRVAAMLLLLVLCAAVSEGLVQAYSVAPVTAQWSGKVRGDENHPISQLVTCNFDSLSYVELFAGDSGSTGGGYRVGVLEDGLEVAYATGVQRQPHSWVKFDNWSGQIAFIKGKQLGIMGTLPTLRVSDCCIADRGRA
jgi:hypothetical protein